MQNKDCSVKVEKCGATIGFYGLSRAGETKLLLEKARFILN
jgi:hypothetical protein